MSFVNTHYFYYAIGAIFVITLLLNRLNANYFKWVKSYWFFERTWTSRISSFLYLLSLLSLMLALLDLRGPEKKVRANLPDQQTIIVLDSSTSMLAEDVRPNRFIKALQLARHFVKSAPGHQISIVLFSDIQKRLIPFTDDIDLIDSRLAALEKTNSVSGGSNISQAIEEAMQYFDSESGDEKGKSGNILVFTDAEESEGEMKVNLPNNVNLAIVGVGTAKGSTIPLRWEDGSFRGYKTFKGEAVTTKLDENYIKKMGKNAKSFKYWIANSYSLPTEEIMNFFRASYNKKQSSGDVRIRPVYSHYILIPAIVLYCLSVVIGRFAIFKMAKNLLLIALLGLTLSPTTRAEEERQSAQMNPDLKKDLEIIKSGKADRQFVLKAAEKLLRNKDEKKAAELYSEYVKKNDEDEVSFNYATALLKSGKKDQAMPLIQDLLKSSKNEDLKTKLRSNLLLSLKEERNKEKQKKDNKDQDKKDDNKDDKKNQDKDSKNNKENQDKKNQQNQNKDNKKNDGKSENDKNKDEKGQSGKSDSQKSPDKTDKKNDLKKEEKKQNEKKDQQKNKNGQEQDQEVTNSFPSIKAINLETL